MKAATLLSLLIPYCVLRPRFAGLLTGVPKQSTCYGRLRWSRVWPAPVNITYTAKDVVRFAKALRRAQLKRSPYYQFKNAYYRPDRVRSPYDFLDNRRILSILRSRLGY